MDLMRSVWHSSSRGPQSMPTWLKLLAGSLVLIQTYRILSFPNARPMCDANGYCHEEPHVPTPRTVYSASAEDLSSWNAFHERLVQRANTFDADGKQAVVFLGDSITESWLGTSMDKPVKRSAGVPEIFEQWAESSGLAPLVLAVSGDQTQHLLHRLASGEMSASIAATQNVTFVMMIGTNNIGRGHLPGPTADGVRTVANWTLEHSKGRLLLLALLPRGDGAKKLPRLCPPRCSSDGTPFASFMPAVDKVNEALEHQIVPALQAGHGKQRVSFADCGSPFRTNEGAENEQVLVELMPDRLHPNAFGHAMLRDCIQEALDHWGAPVSRDDDAATA